MLPSIQSAVFVVAYVTLTWVVVWVNTTLLGRGDPKFDGGYGGQEIYFPIWLIAFGPAVLLAIGSIYTVKAAHLISWTFAACLLLVLMLSMTVCFAFDADWSVVLAVTVLFGASAFIAARVLSRPVIDS